jgi:hypothetical protein
MTKFLSLLAVVGLLASPAFAAPETVTPAAEKKMEATKEAAIDCSKITDKEKAAACEKDVAAKAAAAAKEAAPAAGHAAPEAPVKH